MTLKWFFPQSCLTVLLAVLAIPTASAQWDENVLYSFQGDTDGQWPIGRVVFDSAGNLYGATMGGGSVNCRSYQQCGTVYQLSPPALPGGDWTETVLYVFKGNVSGDASSPSGGLVIDAAGNLYGATFTGGTGNCVVLGVLVGCGTVYELSPPAEQGGAWTEKVLYSFQPGTDPNTPWGDLVFDSAGNLYGTSLFGGGHGTNCGDAFFTNCGAVFELSPPKVQGGAWTGQVLYGFRGVPFGAFVGDGANPNGGLAFDSKGNIYGTTQIGGFNCYFKRTSGCGTVFKLTPAAKHGQPWTETVIHRFNPKIDGQLPLGGLIVDAEGDLYGTTYSGGGVFQFSPPTGQSSSWRESILFTFTTRTGYGPEGALTLSPGNGFCGTTTTGPDGALRGSVYCIEQLSLNPRKWGFGMLHGFAGLPDGQGPTTGLTTDTDGNFYGTTQFGGTGTTCGLQGCGTVFEVSP